MYTMTDSRWQELLNGDNCPFCVEGDNEYRTFIRTLSTSTLYLNNNQLYPGYSLLIFNKRHVTRPSDLTLQEWTSFSQDLYVAQQAIEQALEPDHMNVAALGNQIAHLHYHIIPRYKNDPRWAAPVWTTLHNEIAPVYLDQEAKTEMIEKIQAKFKN